MMQFSELPLHDKREDNFQARVNKAKRDEPFYFTQFFTHRILLASLSI